MQVDWATVRLTLRPAQPEDRGFLYDLANESLVRSQSFSTGPISWQEHCEWYARWRNRTWIVQTAKGIPIGWWRLNAEGEVGVALAPGYRGQGLAADVIRQGSAGAANTLTARVKLDNAPSLRAFRGAGYVIVEVTEDWIRLEYVDR